jgi:hypothetical protein
MQPDFVHTFHVPLQMDQLKQHNTLPASPRSPRHLKVSRVSFMLPDAHA